MCSGSRLLTMARVQREGREGGVRRFMTAGILVSSYSCRGNYTIPIYTHTDTLMSLNEFNRKEGKEQESEEISDYRDFCILV